MRAATPGKVWSCVLLCLSCCLSHSQTVVRPRAGDTARPLSLSQLAGLPLQFEENKGQADKATRFLARGAGYTLLLDEDGLRLAFRQKHHVSMSLVGARMGAVAGREPSPTKTNYYLGNDPANWHLDVKSYRSVAYSGVYKGVDLIYHGSGQQLEYDFVVAPQADPSHIRMRFAGLRPRLQDEDLAFQDLDGVRLKALKAYQWVDGKKKGVEAAWQVHADEASIRLGAYDRDRELIIDPVFFYGTYIGGLDNDAAVAIVPASQPGYYWVALSTSSPMITEPSQSSGIPASNPNTTANGMETLILGIDATAAPPPPSPLPPFSTSEPSHYPTLLVNSVTYLGGTTGYTSPYGMAGDQSGNLYITGFTDNGANFPPLPTQVCSQSCSGFVAKFATSIDAATHTATVTPGYAFGLPATPRAIAVDNSGDVYLTGTAFATSGQSMLTIPTADASFQSNAAASIGTGATPHAFLLELDPTGATLFCSYIGGSGTDQGNAIAVSGDSVFVAGQTDSTDFPTTSNAKQQSSGGGQDGFVLGASKLSSSPSLDFSTYLGGSGTDTVASIAIAPSGNLVVAGSTNSTQFPTNQGLDPASPKPAPFSKLVWPLIDNVDSMGNHVPALPTSGPTTLPLPVAVPAGEQDAFVTSLSADGSHLLFTDFLGGDDNNGITMGQAVAVDNVGVIYLAGSSTGAGGHFLPGAAIGDGDPDFMNFPYTGLPVGVITKIFFCEIDPTGSYLLEATLAGGFGTDQAGGLTISSPAAAAGTVSIVGSTKPTPNSLDGTKSPNLFLDSGASIVVNPMQPPLPEKGDLSDTTGFLAQEALAGFCSMKETAQAGTLLTFSGPCVSGTQSGTLFAFPGSASSTGTSFSAPIAVTTSGGTRTAQVTIDVSSLGSATANFTFAFLPLGAIGGIAICSNQVTSLNGCGIVTAGGGAGTLFNVTSGALTVSLACTENCGASNTATVGKPVTLTAAVTNAIPNTVTWTSSGGVFSGPNPAASITFTPGGTGGPVVVQATPVANPSLTPSQITVNTIGIPPVSTLAILASASKMVAGTGFQFTASQPVTWAATAGTIDPNTGQFTAPNPAPVPATVTITATSQSTPITSVTTAVTVFPAPALVVPAQNTLPAGGSVTIPVSVTAGTGIPGESLSFSCAPATLPTGVSCSFNPNPVAISSGNVQLTLLLSSIAVGEIRPEMQPGIQSGKGSPWKRLSLGGSSMVAAGCLLWLRRRKRWNGSYQVFSAALAFAFLMLLTACGTGGAFSGTSRQGHLTGTYTISINVSGATPGAADLNQTVATAPLSVKLQ